VHSDQDTDYIELDLVLQFLMEDYHKLRINNQKKMANSLRKLCENKDKLQNISVKDFMTLFEENDIIPSKSPSPHVYFAREITKYRALIYSLVCGVQ